MNDYKFLFNEALNARNNSYAPYSDFKVGRLCLPRTEVFLQAAMLKTLLILLAAVQKEQRFLRQFQREKISFRQLPLPEAKIMPEQFVIPAEHVFRL